MEKNEKSAKVNKDNQTKTAPSKINLVKIGSVTKLTGGLFNGGEAEYRAYYPKSSKT